MAKSSVLAPYGIDPFAFLNEVNANAPFTMGTVTPDKWTQYQNQLLAGDFTKAQTERYLQQAEQDKIDNDKKTRQEASYLKSLADLPEGASFDDISGRLMTGARESGDVNMMLSLTKEKASMLKQQATEEEKRKKEANDVLKDIFKLGTDSPEAARQLMDAYRTGGFDLPNVNIPDSIRKPDKPDKPSKTIKTAVGKDGYIYQGIPDPQTGVLKWVSTGLEARQQSSQGASLAQLLAAPEAPLQSGESAAIAATPMPTPVPNGAPSSFLTAPGAGKDRKIQLRRKTNG
jgi:hypothetical protein